MKVLDSLVTQAANISAVRRDIHAHPELSFEELRTADVVAQKLTEWGIPIHRGLGKTGVVGILKNGTSDRAIGLRADMDALPVQEFNKFDHSSQHFGSLFRRGALGVEVGVAQTLFDVGHVHDGLNFTAQAQHDLTGRVRGHSQAVPR